MLALDLKLQIGKHCSWHIFIQVLMISKFDELQGFHQCYYTVVAVLPVHASYPYKIANMYN